MHSGRSRLVYLVLGVFLLEYGGKVTQEVRSEILDYSNWEFERHQFKSVMEKNLRKKYLRDFQDSIRNYSDGDYIQIPSMSLEEAINCGYEGNLSSIDYSI